MVECVTCQRVVDDALAAYCPNCGSSLPPRPERAAADRVADIPPPARTARGGVRGMVTAWGIAIVAGVWVARSQNPRLWLVTLAAWTLPTLLWSFGSLAAGVLFGVEVEEVGLFTGPPLVRLNLRGTTWRINAVPSGSFVKFLETREEPHRARGRAFPELRAWQRITILLAAPATVLGAVACVVGPTHLPAEFAGAFRQIFAGVLEPKAQAEGFLRNHVVVPIAAGQFARPAATVALLLTAINCVPLGTITTGGAVVAEMLSAAFGRRAVMPAVKLFSLLALPYLVVVLLWLYSMVAALLHA